MGERLFRDARLRHDLANALLLVMAFRELLTRGADEALIGEANEALERAHQIALTLH